MTGIAAEVAPQALPSYARDTAHAAHIAAHIAALVDEAPPLPPRMQHLLRPDGAALASAAEAAA